MMYLGVFAARHGVDQLLCRTTVSKNSDSSETETLLLDFLARVLRHYFRPCSCSCYDILHEVTSVSGHLVHLRCNLAMFQ